MPATATLIRGSALLAAILMGCSGTDAGGIAGAAGGTDPVGAADSSDAGAAAPACDACGPDTAPPSAPTGLVISTASATVLTLSWNASTDDVGVVGYSVYRNGTAVGQPSTLSLTMTGLSCGTTYVLGVEARDAAGNHSTRTTLSGATSSCSPAQPSP